MAKDYVISQLQKGEKKRCRKWRIDIKDGRYPSGKQKYKSQRFEGTYTQAEKRAKELAEDRTKLRSRWTFEGYAQHVIDTKLSAGQITKSTHDNYEVYLRMANRTIGGIDLSDLKAEHVEKVYVDMSNTVNYRGKTYSTKTIQGVAILISMVLEDARRKGLVPANVAHDAIRPKHVRVEREALPLAEAVDFETKLDPADNRELAVIIMLNVGLRIGEVCALKWPDVEGGLVDVHGTMHSDGELAPTKTPAGKRKVPISNSLQEALDAAPRHSEWVCGSKLGNPLTPHAADKWWAQRRDSLGLPGWTLHQFRHQFATNLAASEVHPKVMQKLLGHTSPVISLQVYTHVHEDQGAVAINAMNDLKESKRLADVAV